MSLEKLASSRSFGGVQERYRHPSHALGCDMTFSLFRPAQALDGERVPMLTWLSGLSSTDENFAQKAGAQRVAAELGLAILMPDTSPRGPGVPGDPEGAWDFGHGAGFYVDATQEPWSRNYRMATYVVDLLPSLVRRELSVGDVEGICGHSMGGHGALVLALRNPGRYRSVSAIAPISNPSIVPWGEKAFARYLGGDRAAWKTWDAVELLPAAQERLPLLVHQGDADPFLHQLRPDRLREAAEAAGHPLELHLEHGYDHSYYFVASFIEQHLRHHATALRAAAGSRPE